MYVLIDLEDEISLLFESLKNIYDYLLTQFNFGEGGVEAIKLSENKEGGWNVQYKIGDKWLSSLFWKVTKIKENENVSQN